MRRSGLSTRQWSDQLRAVVARSLSEDVRIIDVGRHGSLEFLISWRLGSEQQRPNKRSKVIRLKIEMEAIADYAAASARQRQMADARLEHHLQDRLMRLDPNHYTPLGREPPMVRWSIGSVVLLG